MKDLSTKEFCKKYNACKYGTNFALKFSMMSEVWDALMRGEPDIKNARDWALWIITTCRIISHREATIFALKCAEDVRHLMTDERSTSAIDMIKKYLDGKATEKEMITAVDAAYATTNAAARSANVAANAAASSYEDIITIYRKQLGYLREMENPFAEESETNKSTESERNKA